MFIVTEYAALNKNNILTGGEKNLIGGGKWGRRGREVGGMGEGTGNVVPPCPPPLSWKFIDKTLDYFNFGPSFKKWIKLFQKGSESCILQNGYMSDYFCLQRGWRQGEILSPYIFILCVEVLTKMLRNNKEIRGIQLNETEFKLSQYADDTQIFLDGSEKSMKQLMSTLEFFYKMSCLKINEEKTKALWVRSMSKSQKKYIKSMI